MDYSALTRRYYAHWLGVSPELLDSHGVHWIRSAQRDALQPGYAQRFDLYILIREGLIIGTYNGFAAQWLDALQERIRPGMDAAQVERTVGSVYPAVPGWNVKFCLFRPLADPGRAKMLTVTDYSAFERFFLTSNPGLTDTAWLRGYFERAAARRFVFGVYEGNELVCATDAPTMPYMDGLVQEIGINTLPGYRGQGLATMSCAAAVRSMLEQNICPQWSTAKTNTASQALALKLGFEVFGEVVRISL